MSDISFNMSTESPAPEPLPTPPPAAPLSPTTVTNTLRAHEDVDTLTLRGIANGLVATIKAREDAHQVKCRQLEAPIAGLERNVEFYSNMHEEAPEGYVENVGKLPHFHIPIAGSNGLYHPAKWVKLLEDGRAAGYGEMDRSSDPPHITDIYLAAAAPSNTPYEPLPCWLRRLLTGNNAGYYLLKEAAKGLDNWAYHTEVQRFRQLDNDIVQGQARISKIHMEIEGWSQAREACEGWLAAGRFQEQVGHLNGVQPRQVGIRGGGRRAHFRGRVAPY